MIILRTCAFLFLTQYPCIVLHMIIHFAEDLLVVCYAAFYQLGLNQDYEF